MANSYSDFTIIRVTPTLNNGVAYAAGDVAFTALEIPNAVRGKGGCSKILNCYIVDQDRDTYDLSIFFTEGNTALGTINATADISDADFEAIGFNGGFTFQSDQAQTGHIDQVRIMKSQSFSLTGESVEPMLIQAAPGSTSVYVQGIIVDGTPTFAAADDIDIILHIQYT
tara:strand:+ start:77 stop:586 length:510 start_codon:yes stop_codon:yes gene_type:complete